MLKKFGIVTIGITAGLVAAAPLASASESHHDDHDSSDFSASCEFTGGDAGAGSEISGDNVAAAVAQAPVAGNNISNIANCSDFLNNNGNGNLSGNQVSVLGSDILPTP